MSVKITSRLYNNQFFAPGETTDWLLGNVGDWQRLTLRFEGRIQFLPTDSESIAVNVNEKSFTLNNGKRWSDYGFDIGDTFTFQYNKLTTDLATGGTTSQAFLGNFQITNLFGSVMEHNGNLVGLDGISIIPTNRGSFAIVDVEIKSAKEPEGLKFRYSQISQDDFDDPVVRSFLDQSVTEFSFAGLDSLALGVPADLNPDGFQSGAAISGGTVTKISTTGGVYTYEVEIDFLLPTIFEDPDNLVQPLTPPSVLFNAGSLTDNFEIELYPEWNNPNTVITNDPTQTARLGNTGWFNENFNGLDNNFEIQSVSYFDSDGNPVNSLDYVNETTVEILITGINTLSPASRFGFGFAYIPQAEADYFNNQNPYQDNLFINTGRQYTGGGNDSFALDEVNTGEVYAGNGKDGAEMVVEPATTSLFTGAGVSEVIFRATFKPNAAFAQLFEAKDEADRNYALWVSVANTGLQINFSDRVSLFADYNTLVENIPDAGPFPGMTNKFLEHPQAFNDLGVDKYFGFLNDDILSRVLFSIDKASGDFITGMAFGFVVQNQDTGSEYALQNVGANLSAFALSADGVQDINYDAERGFLLEAGNNKNWVKVLRNPPEDTPTQAAFVAYFAAKLRWEDWQPRDNVAAEFFNTALPNNGLNNDWLDYLRAGNVGQYKFFFSVVTTVQDAAGETLNYENLFELTFNGYDENLNISTDWNYYRDSDNSLINNGLDPETGKPLGTILNDELTRVEIDFENLVEPFDFDFMYGVITLEVDNGGGQFEARQLSSVWGSEPDNPLIPVSGETKAKFELISPTVVRVSARIDPAKLLEASRFRLTARIGCWAEAPGTPVPPGIYQPVYESAYE